MLNTTKINPPKLPPTNVNNLLAIVCADNASVNQNSTLTFKKNELTQHFERLEKALPPKPVFMPNLFVPNSINNNNNNINSINGINGINGINSINNNNTSAESIMANSLTGQQDRFHPKNYVDTFDFLTKNKLIITKNQPNKTVTHTSLEKYKCHIHDKFNLQRFIQMLSKDHDDGIHHYFCEIVNPVSFRMFGDCDLKLNRHPDKQLILNYTRTWQKAMRAFFNNNFRVLVAAVEPEQREESDGLTYYKAGIHWVWPDVVVNIMQAKMIAAKAVALFKEEYPDSLYPPPCNTITSQIDLEPYRASGGGLRMLGNCKAESCKTCKNKNDVGCGECSSKGIKHEGRPYLPKFIVKENGEIDEKETDIIVRSFEYALNISYLRVFSDIRKDFRQPSHLPTIVYKPLDLSSLGINEPYQRARDRKVNQVALLDQELAAAGIPPIIVNMFAGDGSKPMEIDTPLRNEILVVYRHLENVKLNDDDNAQRKFDEALQKKYGSLWSIARFPNTRATLDQLSKNKNTLEPIEFNAKLFIPLEQYIRCWTSEWKNITISTITSNIRSPAKNKCMQVFIEGSTYCGNKRANHTTAYPFFYINSYAVISQRCTSRKQEMRAGGEICPAYYSDGRKLPDHIAAAVRVYFEDYSLLSTTLTNTDRMTIQQEQEKNLRKAEMVNENSFQEIDKNSILLGTELIHILKKKYEEEYGPLVL